MDVKLKLIHKERMLGETEFMRDGCHVKPRS